MPRLLLWIACYLLTRPLAVLADDKAAASPPVWVNTKSHVYHYSGCRWYGNTVQGKYLSEAEALAEGDHADQTEHLQAVPARIPVGQPTGNSDRGSRTTLPPPSVKTGEATFATLLPAPALATPIPAPVPLTPAPMAPPERQDGSGPQEKLSVCLTAIAAQSDPAKLATLGERATNPRLKRIMYYLAQARAGGADPAAVIDQAQQMNGSAGTPRAPLVKASLLRNLKISDGLGLLTPGNMAGLRTGRMPTVTRGPYVGQGAEVDHIVPRVISPETDNELANLEMLPAGLNRSKSAKVGERQLALAKKFREAGLIDDATMARVQAAFRPAGTERYELQEP